MGGSVWSDSTSCYVWGAELITNGSVYYVYNAHGDVIHLLNASGAVTKAYDYDAYGNELSRDLNDSNPFRYCGEYYDTETGFIYLRARYYDPAIGRFTSVDPAKDGLNWYTYCDNDPLNYVDPLGLSASLSDDSFINRIHAWYSDTFLKSPHDKRKAGQETTLIDYLPVSTRILIYYKQAVFENYSNIVNSILDSLNGDVTHNKLIFGQGNWPYWIYSFGVSTVGISGCEAIAIHNALVLLGHDSRLTDVIKTIGDTDSYNFGGAFGAHPEALSRVLDEYGLDYSRVDLEDMTQD